jgi:hypothetical protein
MGSLRTYQRAPHVLIGHSHGGNVALKASSGDLSRENVKVVCLSTPQILAIPRAISTKRSASGLISGYALFASAALAYSAYAVGFRNQWAFRLFGIFVIIPVYLLITRWLQNYRSWSFALCDQSAVPVTLPYASVLFLRFLGDEASFALTTFQAFQYVLARLNQLHTAFSSNLQKLNNYVGGWAGLTVMGILAILGTVLAYFMPHLANLASSLGYVNLTLFLSVKKVRWLTFFIPTFGIFFGLGIAFITLGLFIEFSNTIVYLILIATGILPFGWRLALASFWIEIAVEPLPAGDWSLRTLVPTAADTHLRHSLGYESPEDRDIGSS